MKKLLKIKLKKHMFFFISVLLIGFLPSLFFIYTENELFLKNTFLIGVILLSIILIQSIILLISALHFAFTKNLQQMVVRIITLVAIVMLTYLIVGIAMLFFVVSPDG